MTSMFLTMCAFAFWRTLPLRITSLKNPGLNFETAR